VDYADLAIIDLSKADTVEGRAGLAKQVTQAMSVHGFFYVINHGYTSEQVRFLINEPSRIDSPILDKEGIRYRQCPFCQCQ
jgi:isopenicillin N synthase-like dioxygenase